MPANRSARSVYSTASHLLSPQSLGSRSSPAQSRSHSVDSSGSASSLAPPGHSSSSAYPSSQYSDNPLPRHVVPSHHGATRRNAFKVSKGVDSVRVPPRRSSSPLASSLRKRRPSRNQSVAPAYSNRHRLSYAASSPSPPDRQVRSATGSPLARVIPLHHRGSPFISASSPRPGLDNSELFDERTGWNFTRDEQSINASQDALSEVIMALDVDKDGKVGCAYYVAIDEALVLEEDVSMGGIEAVDTLLLHVQPTSIIIPNRAPGDLVEFLERDAHRFDDNEGSGGEQGSYILRNIVSAHFDYEAGKEALAKVDLEPFHPDPVDVLLPEEEHAQCIGSALHNRLMRLAETINLDSFLSIGCAGAVLHDLERRRAAVDPSSEEGGVAFRVTSIKMNTSANTMLMNADSLVSLQILQSELHPNPQTRSSNSSEPKAKETLSVSGLLQALASTAQGKRKLRQILLRPSTDIGLIRERQRGVGVLLRSENAEVVKNMRRQLRKLKNTKTLLLHVRKGVDRVRGQLSIRVGDWKALLRFAMVCAQLKQATRTLRGTAGIELYSRVSSGFPTPRSSTTFKPFGSLTTSRSVTRSMSAVSCMSVTESFEPSTFNCPKRAVTQRSFPEQANAWMNSGGSLQLCAICSLA